MLKPRGARYDIAHAMSRLGQHMAKPTEASNKALQKVLKYLLTNVSMVVKTWRGRLYHFSSATIFKTVEIDLNKWLHDSDVSDV